MELIDIVDVSNNVIGVATKDEVRAKKLLCRVVFVIILNDHDELLLQQRKATKKTYPLYWSGSAAGHVTSGESYEQAAYRELQEELGIHTPLTELGRFTSEPDQEIVAVFVGRSNGPYTPEESAIEQITYYSLTSLQDNKDTMKLSSYVVAALPMVAGFIAAHQGR
jgi:isopentenyl-diphosphate delta-isomerase